MALLAALAATAAFPTAASATHFVGHDPLDPGGPGLGPPGTVGAIDMFLDPGEELELATVSRNVTVMPGSSVAVTPDFGEFPAHVALPAVQVVLPAVQQGRGPAVVTWSGSSGGD